MVGLLDIDKNLWLQIAQYLTLQKYALFTGLNKAIRTAVNTMPLDYANLVMSFYDIEEYYSRYGQFVGLNLHTNVHTIHKRVDARLFPKLKTLKLDFPNLNSPLGISLPKLGLSYKWENFASLQVLHLSNCQHTTVLDSRHVVLYSLVEIKVDSFPKLVAIPLLGHCVQLQKIILHNCPVLNTVSTTAILDEVNIINCPQLEHFPFLYVNNFYYKGHHFDTAFCHGIITLKHLYVNDAVFRMGKLLPLESLHVINCGLINLPSIPTLKDLKIYSCSINELPWLPALEILDVESCFKLTNITSLNKCKNLRSIVTCGLNSVTCPQVSTLVVFSSMNFAGLDLTLLQSNCNLTTLELDCNKLTTLEGINSLNQLTTLALSGGEITSLQGVENCTSLINLILRDIPYLVDINALRNCTKLQKINLDTLKVKDVTVLMHLIRLHTLRISHCSNVIELPSLVQCGRLENLNVNHSEITTLPALSTSIRHINLFMSTKLHNIQSISKCTNLITLNLTTCSSVVDITAIPCLDVLEVNLIETGASKLILALLKLMFPT